MALRLKDDVVVNKYNDHDDLLVFGYSCKLFRDDEKALYIDQGKHLIPWMGDETLKIDRYDARGTLFDLKQVEAPSGGFDRFFGLTDMERQVEAMCDEERYRALVTNEEEEVLYQEEELKRLHYAIGEKGNSYGQVEYKYEGEPDNVEENQEKKSTKIDEKVDDAGEDEPFVPSPQLDLPLNMILPETMKHNAIIEKTAMFISNQGPQMEILLKMKQAGNPQFNFLSFDNPLHNYYRHLLMAIKSGRYNPDVENSNKKEDLDSSEDDHYLHPSLASSVSKVELAPSIPSINYKPSAHCAYSMLVNKIKDKKLNEQAHISNAKDSVDKLQSNKETETGFNGERCLNTTNPPTQSFVTPPKDMQIIIDKMASYVAKNGRDFETVVQMKNDPRFDFLNSTHMYNPYYQYKLLQYETLEKPTKSASDATSNDLSLKSKEEQSKNKLAPVCFSIKKPKDSEPVIEKSALPIEESSDEEGKNENLKDVKEEKEKDKDKEKEKEKDKEKDKDVEKEKEKEKEEVLTIDLAAMEDKEEKNKKLLGHQYNLRKPPLVTDSAAERLKDKLTVAAREKVALASKEKQIQLERKRRAAAFLKTIQPDGRCVTFGPVLPQEIQTITDGLNEEILLPDTFYYSRERARLRYRSRVVLDESYDKRHQSSNSHSSQKQYDKHRSKVDKSERTFSDDDRRREINDRITDSTISSDEDVKQSGRKVFYVVKPKMKDGENSHKSKASGSSRSSRSEEKRHKKKKHKKDDLDRSSRKHSKLKKEKRSRKDEDSRSGRSKRSRRDSTSSSDRSS